MHEKRAAQACSLLLAAIVGGQSMISIRNGQTYSVLTTCYSDHLCRMNFQPVRQISDGIAVVTSIDDNAMEIQASN